MFIIISNLDFHSLLYRLSSWYFHLKITRSRSPWNGARLGCCLHKPALRRQISPYYYIQSNNNRRNHSKILLSIRACLNRANTVKRKATCLYHGVNSLKYSEKSTADSNIFEKTLPFTNHISPCMQIDYSVYHLKYSGSDIFAKQKKKKKLD